MPNKVIIDKNFLSKFFAYDLESDISFESLGLANSQIANTFTFLDDLKYFSQIIDNKCITGVITTKELGSMFLKEQSSIHLFYHEDPRFLFYTIYNECAKENKRLNKFESIISKYAKVDPSAYVAPFNVVIGEGTIVAPNATILEDVSIGNYCVVQSGTVIGSEGFEYKRTSLGIVPVLHDGEVIIEDYVEIGSNTSIDKGFKNKPTLIEKFAKIDNLVHVAHCVQIKEGAFVIASSMLAGSCVIGNNAWIGPNSTVGHVSVGNNADVTFGAVVTKNVADGEKVSGNFAIPHKMFLKFLKDVLNKYTE